MFSKKLKTLSPYVAGEQPKMGEYIKLNTNENPYPPSPRCEDAMLDYDFSKLRLYPDPESSHLREQIAEAEGVGKENVFVGNGSDEVLALAFRAFFDEDKPVFFPDITYSFYTVYCDLFGISYKMIPLEDNFVINERSYNHDNGGVVIANPNAPTSLSLTLDKIEEIVKRNLEVAVIVDEAYIDFATKTSSAVKLTENYDNLLVVKTFSKSYSLAGMRLGYAIGNPQLITALNMVKNSFNSYPIDRLAQMLGSEAISDSEYYATNIAKVVATRERVRSSLIEHFVTVLDSDSNFLFVAHPKISGKTVYETLKSKSVLVRYFDKERINKFVRVTIGSDEEMDIFLREYLAL